MKLFTLLFFATSWANASYPLSEYTCVSVARAFRSAVQIGEDRATVKIGSGHWGLQYFEHSIGTSKFFFAADAMSGVSKIDEPTEVYSEAQFHRFDRLFDPAHPTVIPRVLSSSMFDVYGELPKKYALSLPNAATSDGLTVTFRMICEAP